MNASPSSRLWGSSRFNVSGKNKHKTPPIKPNTPTTMSGNTVEKFFRYTTKGAKIAATKPII